MLILCLLLIRFRHKVTATEAEAPYLVFSLLLLMFLKEKSINQTYFANILQFLHAKLHILFFVPVEVDLAR